MSGEDRRDIIGALMVGSRAMSVRRFPSGRTCQNPGCRVRLSAYNPGSVCGPHAHFEVVAL